MKKNIENMTITEFRQVRSRVSFQEDIGKFDSLIILPTRQIHDSGYRCMDFVAVRGTLPVCRLSGCSDVIHIDGVGGYGKWSGEIPDAILAKGWSIDCLRKSGLFRIFTGGCYKLRCGAALSSFDIYAIKKPEDKV